jgi:antitoxin component HigA of HigAB toxin-antitoxin module
MKKIKNDEKHDLAAQVIKHLKELKPELTLVQVRRIFITAYHDVTKQLGPDEK